MTILIGTAKGETINGTASTDIVSGLGGDDRLSGLSGADILYGGTGDDFADGGTGNDHVHGGGGNDTLQGSAGFDDLYGGSGNDRLDGGGVNNRLFGGAGNDTFYYNPGAVDVRTTAGLGGQRIEGGPGSDTLRFWSDAFWDNHQQWGIAAFFERGAWRLFVGEFFADDEAEEWEVGTFRGIETLAFDTEQRVTYGAFGTDTDLKVFGGLNSDTFFFGQGTEIIDGRGGADEYNFGPGGGDDVAVVDLGAATVRAVIGAPGDKSIQVFSNDDILELIEFNETIGEKWDLTRGGGRTVFSWEGGSLTIDTEDISSQSGSWGIDIGIGPILDGNEAPVTTRTLIGTSGPDTISGDGRNDRIEGRAGNDVLQGRAGNDVILGEGGNDSLSGGAGRDVLRGGAGNDRLDGGFTGNDLFGDAGNDILIFDPQVEGLVTRSFPVSYLEGGAGRDTLRMVNETEMEREGLILSGFTRLTVEAGEDIHGKANGQVEGGVSFGNVFIGDTVDAWVAGIERFEVVSDGPVQFSGFGNIIGDNEIMSGLEFVGSRSDDLIEGTPGPDRLEGKAGNDHFFINGGDRVISDINDEDLISVDTGPSRYMPVADRVIITGFNGAGAAGGDEIQLGGPDTKLTATEDQAGTLISWVSASEGVTLSGSVHVDAFDLIEGIDYGPAVGLTWLQRTVLPDYGFVA